MLAAIRPPRTGLPGPPAHRRRDDRLRRPARERNLARVGARRDPPAPARLLLAALRRPAGHGPDVGRRPVDLPQAGLEQAPEQRERRRLAHDRIRRRRLRRTSAPRCRNRVQTWTTAAASDASLRRSVRNAKALAHIRVVRPSPAVHAERLAIAADQRRLSFRRVESRRGPCGHDRVRSKRAKAGPRGNRCPRTATAGAGPGWFVFDSQRPCRDPDSCALRAEAGNASTSRIASLGTPA